MDENNQNKSIAGDLILALREREGSLQARIVLYGTHGIGKSTAGAVAESPVFLQAEDGLRKINAFRFPLLKKWSDIDDQLTLLATQKHDFKTLVFDTLDWAQTLLFAQVAQQHNKTDIAAIAYGQGYSAALVEWSKFLSKLDYLNRERGMVILLLAHSSIKRFENPETVAYDRYSLNIREDAAQKIMQWADAVLFVNYVTMIKKDGESFGKEIVRGVGSGDRCIYSQERPGFFAKNKLRLPFEIRIPSNDAGWAVLWEEIKKTY